jgi:hypothetical protein
MPSDAMRDIRAHTVTPSGGKGALGAWRWRHATISGLRAWKKMANRKCYHESSSKPLLDEVYVGKHLSFCEGGKAVRGNAMVANPACGR